MKAQNLLIKLDACQEAIEWVGDKDLKEAWETCPRGDWMLWLAAMLKVNHRTLTLAKGRCAETVVHLMKDKRSINAVNAAIAYGNGKINNEELAAAAAAAAVANADSLAAYAYADAAAYAYADAAAHAAARVKNQKATADICRKILTEEVFNKYNNR